MAIVGHVEEMLVIQPGGSSFHVHGQRSTGSSVKLTYVDVFLDMFGNRNMFWVGWAVESSRRVLFVCTMPINLVDVQARDP